MKILKLFGNGQRRINNTMSWITKNTIANILVRRDGISREEAEDIINNCQWELNNAFASGNIDEAEEIVADWLGLEPEYLEAFLII
jgi:hypothetical protein